MSEESMRLIIPRQLRSARDALGLSTKDVAARLGIHPDVLTRWEEGTSEPSIEELWALAEIYQRDTDYFLKEILPIPQNLSFRLAQPVALTGEAQEVQVRFEELCRKEYELEKLLGERRIVDFQTIRDGLPEQVATQERERLGLGDKPIKDMRLLLINLGVRVFMLPIKEGGISGLSWWHQEYGPCILINARDKAGRRTFTMAHEYAHLLSGDSPVVCDLDIELTEEYFANKFAANFLMPASDLKKRFIQNVGHLGTLPSDEQLGMLSNRYRVSLEALGRRLEDLGLLRRGTVNERIKEWKARKGEYFGRGKPRWRTQLGEHFVSLAFRAQSKERISLSKLANYLGIDIRQARDLVKAEEKTSVRRSKG